MNTTQKIVALRNAITKLQDVLRLYARTGIEFGRAELPPSVAFHSSVVLQLRLALSLAEAVERNLKKTEEERS
jgi:hypothetical protein